MVGIVREVSASHIRKLQTLHVLYLIFGSSRFLIALPHTPPFSFPPKLLPCSDISRCSTSKMAHLMSDELRDLTTSVPLAEYWAF